MHESSLAKDILTAVLTRAQAAGAIQVKSASGWIAETEPLRPESLEFHFQAHAQGTIAEGATLKLELIHVQARCLECDETYLPDHHVTLCPKCGSLNGKLLGKTGLSVESMVID